MYIYLLILSVRLLTPVRVNVRLRSLLQLNFFMVLNNTRFKRVILIDDDPTSLFLTQSAVEATKITGTVLTFQHPVKGLEYIISHCTDDRASEDDRPSLVLLDLNMPVMDGFEFLAELGKAGLNQYTKIRVVVLSSSDNLQDRRRVEHYNVFDFIQKPLTEAQLASLYAISSMLWLRHSLQH